MCIIMSLDVNEMELKGLKLKTCDLPEKKDTENQSSKKTQGDFDSP